MQSKPKILVVDDEDRSLRLVEAMLAPEGYEVVLAHSGEEGLEKIRDICPDIVLLDIMMPGMNGYEVLRILRQRSNIPVIMLTVIKEVTSAIDSLHLGADDYVRKPFMKGELLARIRAKLRRAGTELTPPTS
ncbi:Transcriptional regulatory protein WalR [subsurface metagenome]